MTITIDNEKYGEKSTFTSIEDAIHGVRACGEGFQEVSFFLRLDGQVKDNDGEIVGFETDTDDNENFLDDLTEKEKVQLDEDLQNFIDACKED